MENNNISNPLENLLHSVLEKITILDAKVNLVHEMVCPRPMSGSEAASFLGYEYNYFMNHIKGKIPHHQEGRKITFSALDLFEYKRKQTVTPEINAYLALPKV